MTPPAPVNIFGKRHVLLGGCLSVAPDWYIWLWAYLLTTLSAIAVVWLTHDLWTRTYHAVSYCLLFWNQTSAFVLLCSDPGIYPRGQPPPPPPPSSELNEKPNAGSPMNSKEARASAAFCNECQLYRPPRTSHCYVCGVCILDHDHHCVLLGVCIGKRSQRWFVLYLVTTTLQLYAGMLFLILSFRRTPFEEDWKQLPPPGEAKSWSPEAIEAFSAHATFVILFHLLVMGVIAILMIPVTLGTIAYVLLPLTNTTWREAMHDGIQLRKPQTDVRRCWLVQLCLNVRRMVCSGPSLVPKRKEKP